MYFAAITDLLSRWFSRDNLPGTLGYGIAIICGIFLLTELYSIITQKNEPDLAMMLLAGVLGGLVQGLTKDTLLAILFALCWLMIYSLWTIRQSPVWRELMLSSLISYIVILVGRLVQRAMEMWVEFKYSPVYDATTYKRWGLNGQQWFGISWNIFIYVFIVLCLIFFGRRFFLVSRLTSPQVIYMFIFALSYFVLYRFAGEGGLDFAYPGVSEELGSRLLFASFGTYEIMIIANMALYLISGPLLHFIFGVKQLETKAPVKYMKKLENRIVQLENTSLLKDYNQFQQKAAENIDDPKLLKQLEKIKKKLPEDANKRLLKMFDNLNEKIADIKEHDRVLTIVEEVKQKLNIRGKIKVGKVKAPILNAFAFGAFFDKRIAFMSKDIRDFSDDDIRGIAGHELAHASRLHTLWLMVISAFTFAITKAIQLPATPLDYIFDPDVGLDFLWYYLYNIALVGVSYVFIRFLEGRADRLTMKAGYGKALAKSLIKLDGFYQGIASEMGLSVYLLTNKEQSKAEKVRFLGDSGRNMYRNYIKPSIPENFINLIASHPKSAYRVGALTEQEKLKPFKAAILPFFLVVPFVRQHFVEELQGMRTQVAEVIDDTYKDQYPKTGIQTYDKLTHLSYQYTYLAGKEIVALSKTDKKVFIQGTVTSVDISNSITSPVVLKVKAAKEVHELSISEYDFAEMAIGQVQVFKNGSIGAITEIGTKEDKFAYKAKIQLKEETIKEFTVPGIPIDYFKQMEGKHILFAQKGVTRLAKLDKIEFSESSMADSKFTISGKQTETFDGSKFILAFKPFDVYIKKGKEKEQRELIEYLKDKPASFQTKDDLDTLVKGTVTDVKEDVILLETVEEIKEIKIDRIEFLYFYEDSTALLYKSSLSFIERSLMKLQNRKKLVYIFP